MLLTMYELPRATQKQAKVTECSPCLCLPEVPHCGQAAASGLAGTALQHRTPGPLPSADLNVPSQVLSRPTLGRAGTLQPLPASTRPLPSQAFPAPAANPLVSSTHMTPTLLFPSCLCPGPDGAVMDNLQGFRPCPQHVFFLWG